MVSAFRTAGVGSGALAVVVVLTAMVAVPIAGAETYKVSSTQQLEEAVSKANASAAANTIVVASGIYVPTNTLKFKNTSAVQTIEGPAALAPATAQKAAKIEGSSVVPFPSELFVVEKGVSVVFKDVEVTTGGGFGVPAIEVSGSLELESALVAGNNGTGVQLDTGASATVRNSTISDGLNFGLVNGGSASLFNSTIAFNENGGVENKGTMNLTNTIVAENAGAGDCVGKATASDHSLDSDGSCGVGVLSKVNPLLGPLVNDGGPTPIHSLKPGSPAIDAGDKAQCPATDQRGEPRPDVSGTPCDIGADEYNATPPSIKVPANITTPATGPDGAEVSFVVETTSDDDVAHVSCAPESGSTFPIGKTEVKCTAKDGHEATVAASFTVTVTSTSSFPAVETKPASGETTTTATLNATVNPSGSEVTDCKFEYGATSGYGSSAPCDKPPGSGSSPVAVSAPLSGLSPGSEYHFRISATNAGGTSKGTDGVFKTQAVPVAPVVEAEPASEEQQTTAILNATVNPKGSEVTECKFEYGTTSAYGASAPCSKLPGSGTGPVAVSASLSGLSPGTEYHFRISATNTGGTSKGADKTFKTAPPLKEEVNVGPKSATTTTPFAKVEVQHQVSSQPVAPRATIAGSSFTVSKTGTVAFNVKCPAGATTCDGTVVLRTLTAVSAGARRAAPAKRKKALLTLATGAFSLSGGQSKSITLHLSSKARTLLKRSHLLRARATLAAHDAGGEHATAVSVVTLRLAKKHK